MLPGPCSRVAVAACCALSLVASSCNLPPRDAENLFDPRASGLDSGKFATYEVPSRITRDMLRPQTGPFHLGVGDSLDIEIYGKPATRETSLVMPDGLVYYHTAEGIPADGRTIDDVRTGLTRSLEDFGIREPVLQVSLASVNSRTFWILGQVNSPGEYPIAKPTSLLDSVSVAGGIHDRVSDTSESLADLRSGYMVRRGQVIPIDFEALIRQGDMSQNVALEPGDYIHIPSSDDSSVYVLGSVVTPQSVGYRKNTTLVSALARAGGPTPTAYTEKMVIIRGSLSQPQVAVVDFAEIIKGGATNFHLEPGDIVWVTESPWEHSRRFVVRLVDAAARAIAVTQGIRLIDEDSRTVPSIGINN